MFPAGTPYSIRPRRCEPIGRTRMEKSASSADSYYGLRGFQRSALFLLARIFGVGGGKLAGSERAHDGDFPGKRGNGANFGEFAGRPFAHTTQHGQTFTRGGQMGSSADRSYNNVRQRDRGVEVALLGDVQVGQAH